MEEKSQKPDKIKEGNKKLILTTVICATLVLSIISFGLSVCNFVYNGVTGLAISLGNLASFTTEGSIADVASQVSPSVVSVLTETRTTDWYGQSSTATAAGTGMIVTRDGYILTNKHVVEDAKKISIVMEDGTTYDDVALVGTDPLNDVAFLKVNNVSDLPAVTLGDSKTLSAGQQVIAIGNALGQYQNSVTEGIISSTGRNITATDSSSSSYYERLTDMIQTDASINAGNSGGPLVNAAGEVIGINTAVSASGNNIGFAIPISSIKGMLKSIIETGEVKRAYIGVSYVTVTADVADEYRLDVNYGAYLPTNPISGSPAEKAGLEKGDVILSVNGIKIGKAGSLSTLIGEYAVGDTITLEYLHDGETKTVKITLVEYKS